MSLNDEKSGIYRIADLGKGPRRMVLFLEPKRPAVYVPSNPSPKTNWPNRWADGELERIRRAITEPLPSSPEDP